jgi:uncharacterized membrane protein
MIVQHLLAVAADVPVPFAAGGLGTGRLLPTEAAVVGLVSVVISALALARSAGRRGTGNGGLMAITALVMAAISVVVGALHAVNSAGGFGTGNGLAGAIVAMVVGLVGAAIAGVALACSRRAARTGDRAE